MRLRALLASMVLIAGCGRVSYHVQPGADGGVGADGAVAPDGAVASCGDDPLEPNDDAGSAATVTLVGPSTRVGLFLCAGEEDWVALDLAAGDEVRVVAEYDAAVAFFELEGWLPAASTARAIGSANEAGAELRFVAPASGRHLVRVRGVGPTPGVPYVLRVERIDGPHFFVAPDGDDGGTGEIAQPWRTFAFALSQIGPGDTLVVMDGAYDPAVNGELDANCGAGAALSGRPGAPIRVVALSERRAFVRSGGTSATIHVDGCSDWTIEGLRAENVDGDAASGAERGSAVTVERSMRVTLRRLLVAHNNRFVNSSLIIVNRGSSNLVEECEGYFFHRMGVLVSRLERDTTVRRVYLNDRGYANIRVGSPLHPTGTATADGYPSTTEIGADHTLRLSESLDARVESCAIEGGTRGIGSSANGGVTERASFLGNVALGSERGFVVRPIMTPDGDMDSYFEGNVAVGSSEYGFRGRTGVGMRVVSHTSVDSTSCGFEVTDAPSFECEHCLSVNGDRCGFNVDRVPTWSISRSNAFGSPMNYEQPGDPSLMDATEIDPELGECKVYLPRTSPMRGAGLGGAHVGANLVHRYEEGRRTTVPLWSPVTGRFPCGIVIEGVNDDPSNSCIGLHERLNVNTAACPLPWPD